MAQIELPDEVQRKADALGGVGAAWVMSLPDLVADVEGTWSLQAGETLSGGSGGYVCEATLGDGTPAVLKLAMPEGLEGNGEWLRELRAIQLGQGHGYVRLLQVDEARRATLFERLGRPIGETGMRAEEEIDHIVDSWHAAGSRQRAPTDGRSKPSGSGRWPSAYRQGCSSCTSATPTVTASPRWRPRSSMPLAEGPAPATSVGAS